MPTGPAGTHQLRPPQPPPSTQLQCGWPHEVRPLPTNPVPIQCRVAAAAGDPDSVSRDAEAAKARAFALAERRKRTTSGRELNADGSVQPVAAAAAPARVTARPSPAPAPEPARVATEAAQGVGELTFEQQLDAAAGIAEPEAAPAPVAAPAAELAPLALSPAPVAVAVAPAPEPAPLFSPPKPEPDPVPTRAVPAAGPAPAPPPPVPAPAAAAHGQAPLSADFAAFEQQIGEVLNSPPRSSAQGELVVESAVQQADAEQADHRSVAISPATDTDRPWVGNSRLPASKPPKRPSRPIEPPGGGAGPDFISVLWTMPSGEVPLDFQLQYGFRLKGGWKPATFDGMHSESGIGALQWVSRVNSLMEGEKYTVRIRARNEAGWSDWSKSSGKKHKSAALLRCSQLANSHLILPGAVMIATAQIAGFRSTKSHGYNNSPTAADKGVDNVAEMYADLTQQSQPPAPTRPTESAEGHGPNYLSVSWSMPAGAGDWTHCQFDAQYGFRVGAWRAVPPSKATVEDDGWGGRRWTMRLTTGVWPSGPGGKFHYLVRVRAGTAAAGWGDWSKTSIVLECKEGMTQEEARRVTGNDDVDDFLSSVDALATEPGLAVAKEEILVGAPLGRQERPASPPMGSKQLPVEQRTAELHAEIEELERQTAQMVELIDQCKAETQTGAAGAAVGSGAGEEAKLASLQAEASKWRATATEKETEVDKLKTVVAARDQELAALRAELDDQA